MANLTVLRSLHLNRNEMAELPDWLAELTSLTSLEFAQNQVAKLGGWIGDLDQLENLDMTDNLLTTLPEKLGDCRRLIHLRMVGNLLVGIPRQIFQLPRLATLLFSCAKIREMNDCVLTMPSLLIYPSEIAVFGIEKMKTYCRSVAVWRSNEGTDRRVCQCDNPACRYAKAALIAGVVELDAQGFWSGVMRLPGVMFRAMPAPMLTVGYLLKVNLSGNIISEFPMNLLRCMSLVELRLDKNDFTHVPLELSRNTKLKVLTLHGNPRLAVPSAYIATKGSQYLLEYFRRFSEVFADGEEGPCLDLLNMRLPIVPPEVYAQTQLVRLSLSRNRLYLLSPEVGRLSFLMDLDVSWNYLHSLPDNIGELDRLEVINFASNKLYTLPDSMSQLTNLRTLLPNSNRLGNVPASVLEQGPLKVLQFISRSNSCRSTGELDLAGFGLAKYPGVHSFHGRPYHSGCHGMCCADDMYSMLSLQKGLGAISAERAGRVQLHVLDLSDNKIAFIPIELGLLTSLTILSVARNALFELPAEIGRLTNLEILAVDQNKLFQLPPEIVSLSNARPCDFLQPLRRVTLASMHGPQVNW